MFCSNCGKRIGEKEASCPYCGSVIEEEEFCSGFWGIVNQAKDEKQSSVENAERKEPGQNDKPVHPKDEEKDTDGAVRGILVRVLIGIIGLLLFLLIIQSIRLGIAGHTESELRKENAELEQAQTELIKKNSELQQLLEQLEFHDEQDTGEPGNNMNDTQVGEAEPQSSIIDNLQFNDESGKESNADSDHGDTGQDESDNSQDSVVESSYASS